MARSPFYRRFHKGLEHAPLGALPALTKAEVMSAFDDTVTDRAIRLADVKEFAARMQVGDLFRGRYHIVATSGTTGERGYFLFDPGEWRSIMAGSGRALAWTIGGSRPPTGERTAMMTTTVPWHMSARGIAEVRRLGLGGETVTFDSGEPVEAVVAKLNMYQPTSMGGYPSMMQILAGEKIAGRLTIAPTRIGCGAEVLTDEAREGIRRAFGVEPSNTYGVSECGWLGATCTKGSALHVAEDMCFLEVVDEHGRPVPPGEAGAKAFITVFASRTMPLIRYELMDRLTLEPGPCACGMPFARIESVGGRTGDVLTLPAEDGGTVTIAPAQIGACLRGLPVVGWQLSLSPDELVMECVAADSEFDADGIAARVRSFLASRRAMAPNVRATRIDRLVRGRTGKSVVVKTLSR